MKKLLLLFALSIVSLQFFSCSTDYDGPDPVNQKPIINVYDTSDITSSKKTKIQWYGNDVDGTKLTYYYTVTTDTTLDISTVLTALPLDGLDDDEKLNWTSTDKTYAYISMPYGAYHSDKVFLNDTTYTMTGADSVEVSVPFKAVYSRFFVFGVDEKGSQTEMNTKVFQRTNRVPKHPMVFSSKLGLNGFDKYWMTVGPDSAQMVLPAATAFWKPFDFKWMGEDPDGTDVDLEFRWELWERRRANEVDTYLAKIDSSAGWSVNNLSKSFDNEIYDHNRQGQYTFKVFVRDDAFEESVNEATINFEVFAPEFNKGILFIDDTDPLLYPPSSNLIMGNPNGTNTSAFYKDLLDYAGFSPDSLVAGTADSLKGYVIKRFMKGTELVGYDTTWVDDDFDPTTPDVIDVIEPIYRGVYDPSMREIVKYRLVIIASDDRSNKNGVDFAGEPPYTGYNTYLSSYLDVGGNLFMLGNSTLMGKLYSSPDQLPINNYYAPYRQIFDSYAPVVATISNGTKDFFNKYFGIYSMTFPEQKTYLTITTATGLPSASQLCADKGVQADNYDFIGASLYEHITDANLKPLKIDSARVNDAWWNKPLNATVSQKLALKDNGTVFTGVPTFEAYKGEVVYRYKSIYDLPVDPTNDSLVVDGDMTHSLWWKDPFYHTQGEVTRRTGSVATRYISESDVFRTAFFGIPTYFLDNSDNQVSDMFKTMIEWFDIENDGGSK